METPTEELTLRDFQNDRNKVSHEIADFIAGFEKKYGISVESVIIRRTVGGEVYGTRLGVVIPDRPSS